MREYHNHSQLYNITNLLLNILLIVLLTILIGQIIRNPNYLNTILARVTHSYQPTIERTSNNEPAIPAHVQLKAMHQHPKSPKRNIHLIRHYIINYINTARTSIGLDPLHISKIPQLISHKRALQGKRLHSSNHYDKSGHMLALPMYKHANVKYNWSEDTGTTDIMPGIISGSENSNGFKSSNSNYLHVNNTAKNAAYGEINDMLNHDSGASNYGHRDSLLTSASNAMGVSVSYSHKTKRYYIFIEIEHNLPSNIHHDLLGWRFEHAPATKHKYITKRFLRHQIIQEEISHIYTTQHNVYVDM